MKRVCAWCKKLLGERASDLDAQDLITHGICEECEYHLFAQMGMPLHEFLDGLGVAVFVVDSTGSIQTANRQARTLLHKELPEIEGHKGGNVFECAYSTLPEGCGNTIHCSGCAIRRTVMDTLQTGHSQARVPAYLNQETPDGVEKIRFLISTERVAEVILLRIDQVGDQAI